MMPNPLGSARLFTIGNSVSLLLGAVAIAALGCTSFMSHAPNRLADGIAFTIWSAPAMPVAAMGVALAGLLALALVHRSLWGDRVTLSLGVTLALATLVAAGQFADVLTEAGHPAQRQSLGPAFWLALGVAGLIALDAMRDWRRVPRALFAMAFVIAFVALVVSGLFDRLSLAKEFASHRAIFVQELLRHVEIVVASIFIAIVVCAPLVWAVRRRARGPIFATLGLLQTIPSIALFGLLITPLGFIAAHVPVLKAIGFSGLGVTPTLIALVLYAAFPLVRMSDAALSCVPVEVSDAAKGMGFGRAYRLRAIAVPLAMPVLLSGLRVVTLQAIGLATVAALIGGGGLGTFVFEGIGEYALDLVLVGAIPVIALALAVDFGFRLALAAVRVPG